MLDMLESKSQNEISTKFHLLDRIVPAILLWKFPQNIRFCENWSEIVFEHLSRPNGQAKVDEFF